MSSRPPLDQRLAAARREGWSLKLHAADCDQIAADPDIWLERGLAPRALKRIQAAIVRTARYGYDARLSVNSTSTIRPASGTEIGRTRPADGEGADRGPLVGKSAVNLAPPPTFPLIRRRREPGSSRTEIGTEIAVGP